VKCLENESSQHEQTACTAENKSSMALPRPLFHWAPAALASFLPRDGLHSRAGNRGTDVLTADAPLRGNRHFAAQKIKGKVEVPTHQRPDLALQHGDFLTAAHTLYPK
jgi:hypothetical protein